MGTSTPTVTTTATPTATPTASTSAPPLAPTSAPTPAPSKEATCRDDPDFRYKNNATLPCEKMTEKQCKQWDKVTKKRVKSHCPVQCGYCNDPDRCVNPTTKIPVKVGHRKGRVTVSCDQIPIAPLVECMDVINKKIINDLCPGSCDLCNQW